MDMTGRVVLITGANRGLGFEAARQLAEMGAEVAIVCRSNERGRLAREQIEVVAKGPPPRLFIADLSLLSEVRAVAHEVRSALPRLDVLINNAGGIFTARELTLEGLERTFATNHLAPFLLTNLLLDRLRESDSRRVVTVTSDSHSGTLDFSNMQGERRYSFFGAYNRSKLCNVLFTYELARRLERTTLTANCVSPGPTRTGFGDNVTGLGALLLRTVKRIPSVSKSQAQNAQKLVQVAASPDMNGVTGRFFSGGRDRPSKSISYDHELAARLWRLSDELCAASEREASSISGAQR